MSVDHSRTLISYNDSPDVPFDRSINPYRGCEHGCIYCYARPSHAWLGESPGLDFESRLYYKPDAPECLRRELAAVKYSCSPVAIGGITDILLRLPLEVAPLFSEWLQTHKPGQAERVLKRIRDTRNGSLNRSDFETRMRGEGPYAELIAQRFRLAWKRLGYCEPDELDCAAFVKPGADFRQLRLL